MSSMMPAVRLIVTPLITIVPAETSKYTSVVTGLSVGAPVPEKSQMSSEKPLDIHVESVTEVYEKLFEFVPELFFPTALLAMPAL